MTQDITADPALVSHHISRRKKTISGWRVGREGKSLFSGSARQLACFKGSNTTYTPATTSDTMSEM